MTDQEYPFIPPYELVQEWGQDANLAGVPYKDDTGDWLYEQHIATRAAQWGAGQELEACIDWLANARNHTLSWNEATNYSANLRAARRPKPSSLKEQALALLDKAEDPSWDINDFSIVRKALEQLDD